MLNLRRRFVTEAVSTAGPATLLMMLLDRLDLDLDRADQALEAGDRVAASEQLMHAQQIIDALRSSLNTEAWDGAVGLASIYDYVFSQLVTANIRGDREVLGEVRQLVAPLRESWALAALSPEGTAALSGPTPAPQAYDMPEAAGVTGGLLGVG